MDISMRPSAAAKLDQAGTAAAEDKGFLPGQPSWSKSTATWGLRAYPKGGAGGPVDVYLGGGENRAGEFHRAFDHARFDVTQARHSQSKRATHASAALTKTLSTFSHRNHDATQSLHQAPGVDRYVGGGPKCRTHTREFCIPTFETHKVFMGYVDPVDLAHSMTEDGFNVRGVNLPLIGQPIETPDQGLAKQPKIEFLGAAEHKWGAVWGGGGGGGAGDKRGGRRKAGGPRSISMLETRAELEEFERRVHPEEETEGGEAAAAASGSSRQAAPRQLPQLTDKGAAPAAADADVPRRQLEAMAGTWTAEVERRDSSPSLCKFELRLVVSKRGKLSGAGRQSLNGKQWVCRVNSGKVEDAGLLKLNLFFGPKDTEEWHGKLEEGEGGEAPGGEVCCMMQARTNDWLSSPFRLTRVV